MKDIGWYVNRIRAMSIKEVGWRIWQKQIRKKEKSIFFLKHLPVTELPLPTEMQRLKPVIENIPINWENKDSSLFERLYLFGAFDYERYKRRWNAGFQTENNWPEDIFSYDLSISQREDIGDIRTNWELNRHYQFSALAKSYYISGDTKYLNELKDLFENWNSHNLFLHGPQWTSTMEMAIRANSWIYTYCFTKKAFDKYNFVDDTSLLEKLSNGILLMTHYITEHYARFSSANNHLIVEMYAVALAGFLFNHEPWIKMSLVILTRELPIQNYSDGVNKEMSLHYQSFVMEAYGLLMLTMRYNLTDVPGVWTEYLSRMSEYLCDCCGEYGETIVFGDNDEGRILDLAGREFDYYRSVLDLMGIVLPNRYSQLECVNENLKWLVAQNDIRNSRLKNRYCSSDARCYREGGYTLLRSRNHKLLIGIDHAELGYGKLAAHGHADALSMQAYYCGKPLLIDPGTYNYHVPKKMRDEIRLTKAHNTVYVDGYEQAEAKGPFLWGRRFRCSLQYFEAKEDWVKIKIQMENNAYNHIREIAFDYKEIVEIDDYIDKRKDAPKMIQIWNIPDEIVIMIDKNISEEGITIKSTGSISVCDLSYSSSYGELRTGKKILICANDNRIHTTITVVKSV